jgi:hypothetical protein
MTATQQAFNKMQSMTKLATGKVWCSLNENCNGYSDGTSESNYHASIIHNNEQYNAFNCETADDAAELVVKRWIKGAGK